MNRKDTMPASLRSGSTDPFDDLIKETASYTALGKTFNDFYSARRAVAGDKLRLAVQETHARLPLVLTEPTSNKPATATQLAGFDRAGEQLREWLVDHVHVLLPALQLVAQANPPITMHAVEPSE